MLGDPPEAFIGGGLTLKRRDAPSRGFGGRLLLDLPDHVDDGVVPVHDHAHDPV